MTNCPHCGANELRKGGIYYGKHVTTQRFQCKGCKSYFGIDITKDDENTTNALTSAHREK